jgi:hypothetical protein
MNKQPAEPLQPHYREEEREMMPLCREEKSPQPQQPTGIGPLGA